MTNQCFWISLSDWFKIVRSYDTGKQTAQQLRTTAEGLGIELNDEKKSFEINRNNAQGLKDFANELKIRIRIFYPNYNEQKLFLGDDFSGLDFGDNVSNDVNNDVLIAYFGNHFELITKINQDGIIYNIPRHANVKFKETSDTDYYYYDDNNELIKVDTLPPEIINQQMALLKQIQPSSPSSPSPSSS